MTRPQSPLSPPEVTVAELVDDPYPIYRRLRDAGPCVWLSPANRYVVTRWDDVFALDENPALTAAEPDWLMTRAMARAMGPVKSPMAVGSALPVRFQSGCRSHGSRQARL